jgi:hypothetical protein
MKTSDLIKKTVFSYVEKDFMFTSMDISQTIKKGGKFVRNSTVRDWLRDNFWDLVNEASSGNLFTDPNIPEKIGSYETCSIQVRGGTAYATLYKPDWADEEDYGTRNLVPMTPSEVNKIVTGAAIKKDSKPADPDITDLMDGKVDIVSRSINSLERIKIPGAMAKRLGWSEGTVIDKDKAKLIKTDKPLPDGLKVNKDLRISIPRDVVSVPNPVKVRCDGYVITFEKA